MLQCCVWGYERPSSSGMLDLCARLSQTLPLPPIVMLFRLGCCAEPRQAGRYARQADWLAGWQNALNTGPVTVLRECAKCRWAVA